MKLHYQVHKKFFTVNVSYHSYSSLISDLLGLIVNCAWNLTNDYCSASHFYSCSKYTEKVNLLSKNINTNNNDIKICFINFLNFLFTRQLYIAIKSNYLVDSKVPNAVFRTNLRNIYSFLLVQSTCYRMLLQEKFRS